MQTYHQHLQALLYPGPKRKQKREGYQKKMRVGNILNINHQEHSKVWITDEKDPPGFNFDENVGFKVNIDSEEPKDYFGVFFTDTLVSLMVAQTNLYAENVVNNARPLRRFSRMQKWEPVTVEEMRIFVGLTLLMGPIQLPTIIHYWSRDPLYAMKTWRNKMSRNRYQNILKFWHFTDNENPRHSGRLYKIQPILDYFDAKMRSTYIPNNYLSLDESMILWRGRLIFRQYIKNKRHKYGVKLYELCESNGIVLRIYVYSGEGYSDQDNLGQTGAIVQYWLDDFLDKGYHVFIDNYYNSIPLTARSTYITGTLNKKRVGIPYPIKRLQLVRGEHRWMRSGSTVVCKWKDKREVLTITNAHKVEMCDVMNNRGKVSQKPNVVADYNNGMSGIDLSDQMISYYSNLRKTLKWCFANY